MLHSTLFYIKCDLAERLTSLFCSILCYDLQGIRSEILQCVTKAAAMPLSQLCHVCKKEASMRCCRCGPLSFFCVDCFESCHEHNNIFHVGKLNLTKKEGG